MTFIPYESLRTFEPSRKEMRREGAPNKVVATAEIPSIESKDNLNIKNALTSNVT
ncbi:MAG: hypothetical protein ACYDEJ_09470 [Desulfitobacteriaceae bacterium]